MIIWLAVAVYLLIGYAVMKNLGPYHVNTIGEFFTCLFLLFFGPILAVLFILLSWGIPKARKLNRRFKEWMDE